MNSSQAGFVGKVVSIDSFRSKKGKLYWDLQVRRRGAAQSMRLRLEDAGHKFEPDKEYQFQIDLPKDGFWGKCFGLVQEGQQAAAAAE